MTFEEYQKRALTTGRDRDKHNELFHRVLGLVGEAGEIAEKIKKLVRDENTDLAKLNREDMNKELGDVLWYVAVLADYLDLSLEDIAQKNLSKLADRQQRGVIKGQGDNR